MQINSQMNPQSQGFNDISAGEYDLVVDETLETSSMRHVIAEILQELSHQNPGMIPPDIILEYINLPYTAKQKVKMYFERMAQIEQENKDADRAIELMKLMDSRDLESAKLMLEELKIGKEKKDGNSNAS
jgi:hypothetical protein